MKNILKTLALVCFIGQIFAQEYTSVESVEYDAINDRWISSNGNNMISDDGQNNLSFFGQGKTGYGLVAIDNLLYGISGVNIKVFDLNTEEEIKKINIAGTSFMNGLTSDGSKILYTTDFIAKKIYRIDLTDLDNPVIDEIVSNTIDTPNGIIYDGDNNRLIYVCWKSNAKIRAVDLNTFEVSEIYQTSLGNIDGIDTDKDGNYYISSWTPDQISKFDPEFSGPPELIETPFLDSPADICIAKEKNIIGIPLGDAVVFVDLNATSTLDDQNKADFSLKILGNPGINPTAQFKLINRSMVSLDLFDQHGRLVRNLINGYRDAGNYNISFAGNLLPESTYICRLQIGKSIISKQLIIQH